MGRKWLWVPTLLGLALLGAACSRSLSNSQIENNIKVRMFSDPQLVGTSLHVKVKQGIVTLTGRVPSVAARYEAFKVASDATGVKKVNDQMTIEEPSLDSRSAANRPRRAPRRETALPRSAPSEKLHFHPMASANAIPLKKSTAVAEQTASAKPMPGATASGATRAAQATSASIEQVIVPKGTHISVRMVDSISSSTSQIGDIFHATLAKPLVIRKKVIAPKGTDIYLRLVDVRSAGHLRGRSELRVELYRLVLNGTSYPLVSNDHVVKGSSRGKQSAFRILGGAAIGTAIGAFAGGGKGAAIGAAAGGGGGAAYQGLTKAKQAKIPSEAVLHFKLEQPVSVSTPSSNSSGASATSGSPKP